VNYDMSKTTQNKTEPVELARSDLRTSRRTTRETPPLVRGEVPDPLNEDIIDVPVPVAGGVDLQVTRVLHVDDDPEIGELTKTLLERADDSLTVVCETNAVAALNRLESEEFDCVISDYDMPNTDGIELLEIVRKQSPDLPFILLTGKGSEEVASEAISKGVTDYMQKGGGTDRYEVLANRVCNAVERYRTQQRFWNALTWYRRLVEQDLAGVFLVQDREFIYVNDRFADLFGYSQCDLVGASPVALASGSDDECVVRDLLQTDLDGAETFECEFTGERADGAEVPVEIHGGAIQYEGDPAASASLEPEH
jgi:PAS domain S-box